MRWIRRIQLIVLVLVPIGVAAFFLLPWKHWVEAKLRTAIEARGIYPVALTLDRIGLDGVIIRDLALGEPPLTLKQCRVGYEVRGLLRGKIAQLTLDGLSIVATKQDMGWKIDGLGALTQHTGDSGTSSIPVTRAALGTTALPAITIEGSMAEARAQGWSANVPWKLVFASDPSLSLTFTSDGVEAQAGENKIASGPIVIKLVLDEEKQQWAGTWSVDALTVTGDALGTPKLRGVGEIQATADRVSIKGGFSDAAKQYHLTFALTEALQVPEASQLAVEEVVMPWGGGTVSLEKLRVPLAGKSPIQFALKVNKVGLSTLLKALSSDAATATGVVSGEVPVIYAADGKITIGNGALKAEAPGIITLSPEAIPGDNPQVGLVREVMKNLHYDVLALSLGMSKNHQLSAGLAVQGKNPDVQGGRPIKLQVNLSGDLLNLLLQNMKLMTDPTKFIDESTHEKTSN